MPVIVNMTRFAVSRLSMECPEEVLKRSLQKLAAPCPLHAQQSFERVPGLTKSSLRARAVVSTRGRLSTSPYSSSASCSRSRCLSPHTPPPITSCQLSTLQKLNNLQATNQSASVHCVSSSTKPMGFCQRAWQLYYRKSALGAVRTNLPKRSP